MRKMRFQENTIKDLATLNRGQSMLLGLYVKGYTHAQLQLYKYYADLEVFAHEQKDLDVADMIIRNQLGDGDTIEYLDLSDTEGPLFILRWRGNFIETEDE